MFYHDFMIFILFYFSLLILLYFVISFIYINNNYNNYSKILFIQKLSQYSNIIKPNNINYNQYIIITNLLNYNENINYQTIKYNNENENDDILFITSLYGKLNNYVISYIFEEYELLSNDIIKLSLLNNITLLKNGIIINIQYLNLLFINNLFPFNNKLEYIKYYLENNKYNNLNIKCNNLSLSNNYSIILSIKNEDYLNQINTINNQINQPEYIILINYNNYNINNSLLLHKNIILIDIINFNEIILFEYLFGLLSPINNLIIYDDYIDNKFKINKELFKEDNNIIGYKIKKLNNIEWCEYPLLINKEWLYLFWLINIYDKKEIGNIHLSLSLNILCNIKCIDINNDSNINNDNELNNNKYLNNYINYFIYIKNKYDNNLISFNDLCV